MLRSICFVSMIIHSLEDFLTVLNDDVGGGVHIEVRNRFCLLTADSDTFGSAVYRIPSSHLAQTIIDLTFKGHSVATTQAHAYE